METLLELNTSTFGNRHIIVLAVCILFIAGSLVLLKKKNVSLKTAERFLLGIGIISESIKVIYYIVSNEEKFGGYLPKTDLPFHLCSLQLILIIVLNLTNNGKIKKLIYSFMIPTCLVGGIAALLLPTSSARSQWVVTVQYFLFHSAIIIFAIYLYMSSEVKLNIKDYRNCLICVFAMFFIAIYLNSWVNDYQSDINFMYVVKPPVEGLYFLNTHYGWLPYIVHYAGLVLIVITLCYIKPIVVWIKEKITSKKQKTEDIGD